MSKRSSGAAGFSLAGIVETKKQNTISSTASHSSSAASKNPFLSRPVQPEDAIKIFLSSARSAARQNIPKGVSLPISKPFCEIEARIGVLKSPMGLREMRVLPSGPKRVNMRGKNVIANAFDCSAASNPMLKNRPCKFENGITKTHCTNWTAAGLSDTSSISSAFGVTDASHVKRDLVEKELVETVFAGYPTNNRVCFPGDHKINSAGKDTGKRGCMENKSKLTTMDVALPAAAYDLRLNLSTERTLDHSVIEPPRGWSTRRLKRRRSYTRRDQSFAWQLDVTEVTTNDVQTSASASTSSGNSKVEYEIEMELNAATTLKLVNENDPKKAMALCTSLSQQLWWMLGQINPLSDVLDVEEYIRDHPDTSAVQLALAQCGSLKKFMDSRRGGGGGNSVSGWTSAIAPSGKSPTPSAGLANIKFPGCMPVNFSRHNIEEVQRSDDQGGYYLSEKTDGVRHLMVFTGNTVVLVDRAMKGKQIVPRNLDDDKKKLDPMASVIPLIKPGTVLDGEVVMHRKLRRPLFIVFDVLCLSATQPILHLPFAQRLHFLRRASFRSETADRDMFATSAVRDPSIAMPLVRKNFVRRIELDELLSHVVEEKGMRSYRNGEVHNHLTDGIIFQPNAPYVCGTDHSLLKWKYLDTVTIDVQIMPPGYGQRSYGNNGGNDNDDSKLTVAVTGEEGSMVEMSRFIHLPRSELRRLEADRAESGANIVEVGLEPTTGEWYYLTMRPDKIAPNHISTVMGTLMELAESLGTEELRYRMSVPSGGRDTYRKDMRKMQKQLLDHQRKVNKA
eukprot:CAMPEP_0194121528 /NCGR_PEP_ID=MMETSP0150-20130528/47384_1 /TAXON_ID=122233 /ORGANISM="Chaetoceros debilis, Strain MM31A-1" /LENGTH=789 /DNA_ID=CAMNT_0038813999 /DNA_START=192 /DNA_END=2557 /DNA_ORIENTATION=-